MKATLEVNQYGAVFLKGKTLIVDSLDNEVQAKLESKHINKLLVSLYEEGYLTETTLKEIKEGKYE